MIAPQDRTIDVNHLRLHYLEWGEADRRPMVLLHGIGDNAHVWDMFAREAARRLRVIAVDQRGHGRSNHAFPPAYRCEDYVQDLQELITRLGLNPVILMGHSMGALHATRYAALHPEAVAGLIHVDIEPWPPEWNKRYLMSLYRELPEYYDRMEDYLAWKSENDPYARKEILYPIALYHLDRDGDGRLRCQYDREVLRHFDTYDLRPFLGNITCPSLIVRGKDSPVMTAPAAEAMCRALPQGRLAEIPEAVHPVHTDNPAVFHQVVWDFLEENGWI